MKTTSSKVILNYLFRLLTIISGVQNLLSKTIDSFSDFVLNQYKYVNLGLPSEKERVCGRKRGKEIEKVFKGDNVSDEVKKFLAKEGIISQSIIHEEKDEIKSRILYNIFRAELWA